jgi:glycosyltransferase involved in cell wall biosynthesis
MNTAIFPYFPSETKEIIKLSVIIPVYNEEKFVSKILAKASSVVLINNIKMEIIIVDDHSNDNTLSEINKFIESSPKISINFVRHTKNLGKGAAIHTGIALATGEYVVIQDADLEYDPEEYNDLLKPIVNGFADVVYGSRFMGNNPHRILFFWHTIGNRFLTFLTNMFSNLNMTDMETCYKLFNTKLLKSINLREKRFGFEPEVTIKISRISGIRIYEVGISYYGRGYEEGKKIGWRDGLRAIICILKYGFLKIS